ncbi:MAG: hypothetical protein HC769_33445 [Cyanobacteria bacterium CRU_2_1]|nr:hypothetical protein [Cyanobacteria bacterium CRU_2_1]
MSDNKFATARNIGSLTTNRTFTDSIGKTDKVDFYKFTLSSRSTCSISLRKLSANASISLFSDQNRQLTLAKSARSGTQPEQITKTLDLGTYYIKVNSSDNRNTRYTLSAAAAAVTLSPPTVLPPPQRRLLSPPYPIFMDMDWSMLPLLWRVRSDKHLLPMFLILDSHHYGV